MDEGAGGIIAISMELEKAKRNMYLRDKFLVEKGLWQEFVSQLPLIPALKSHKQNG